MMADEEHRKGNLLSTHKLFGTRVENPRGEHLGRVEDLMISADGGQVVYAVVSFGGVLSLGNKLFAFPWSALQVDLSKKKVMINLDKKALSMTRGFDKNHWPEASDWNGDQRAPSPALATQKPEVHAAPSDVCPTIQSMAAAKNGMDHWGKNWESHGLDRR